MKLTKQKRCPMKHLWPMLIILLWSCEGTREQKSESFRITERSQLIGGPTALGEVGDYMLQNEQIRIIVQDKTFNRGSGIFGGSLIDADLRHSSDIGGPLGGNGNDTFGEMFPSFFMEMIDPDSVEVIADGQDGKAAIIEVKGKGGEFITMIRYLNQLLLGSYKEPSELIKGVVGGDPPDSDFGANIEFSTRYILEPEARHIRIESKMRNISLRNLEMPPQIVLNALKALGIELGNFRLPLGHILGFGALSKVFLPGLGFDLQQGLVEELSIPVALPGFPGKLTNLVASTNTNGVNYGFIATDRGEDNFAYQTDLDSAVYSNLAEKDDMLYLFNASGFGGVFSARAPLSLSPDFCQEDGVPENACREAFGPCKDDICNAKITDCVNAWESCRSAAETAPSEFTFTNYFILGTGDVASIYDEIYKIRNVKTHTINGEVIDEVEKTRVGKNESVMIYTDIGGNCSLVEIISQAFTFEDGQFEFELPDGDYCFQSTGEGRPTGDMIPIKIQGTSPNSISLIAKSSATLITSATDESGQLIPFKVTLVGIHEELGDRKPKDLLVNLTTGAPWKPTDLDPDNADSKTRRYIEETKYSDGPGIATMHVRPGKYQAVISRGLEYGIDTIDVDLKPGQTLSIAGTLERAIDTSGYLGGDFHIHSAGSIDSGLDNNLRVKSLAGEGVEIAVSTEHNYVTDFAPYIQRNNLQNFMRSTVGLELTTFEAGHFNAFPVDYNIEKISRGSVRWQGIPPERLFAEMRDLYDGENIVQVNHPRTPILGYFAQHNLNAFDTTISLPFLTGDKGFSTATLASPNGPAFYTSTENPDGDVEYRSTFSWNFDAIEILGGRHLEELRHFRMPYDKSAAAGAPNAMPSTVRSALRSGILEDFFTDGVEDVSALNEALAMFLTTPDMLVTEDDVEMFTKTKRDETITSYVESRIPNENDVLCNGDDVLQPGALDDWYNLLNRKRPDGTYKKYTATGNSDTHDDRIDEPGFPRNFFWVGDDSLEKYTDKTLVDAMKSHHNIVTNGPFVWFKINDKPIGSELIATGPLSITVHIEAANWVNPSRFRILANGEPLKNLEPDQDKGFWGWVPINLDNNVFEATYSVSVDKDSWFVVEVEGDNNLFPVVSPQDIPPFNFSDVVGSLAGVFGLTEPIPGLGPETTFPVTPFAFTNPIWVIVDGDGEFTPANPPVIKCEEGILVNASVIYDPQALKNARKGRLKPGPIPGHHDHKSPLSRPKGEDRDVRILFEAFGGHAH